MDHIVVSLLNTAREATDPLETPLGAARWWASVQPEFVFLPRVMAAKPRFDLHMVQALRALRLSIGAVLEGGSALPAFTGNPSTDAVLFPVAYAAAAMLTGGRFSHIRPCARTTCRVLFLDETKNGSRRWCSLRCMERSRAPRRRTIGG
jgi:predicted RNA-binding Zn ribbon-like protein